MTTLEKIKKLAPLFLAVLLCGCPAKEVELPGDISGNVQDAVTGESVNDAEVKLFHTNDLVEADTTGMDGTFLFTNLESSNYSIEVNKEMYESHAENISVFPATTEVLEIIIRGVPDPEYSSALLYYGMENTQLSFSISNVGGGLLNYEIIPTHDWISLSQESGEISQEPDLIEVSIQKEGLREVSHKAWITIHSDILDETQVDSIDIYVNYVIDRDSIFYRTVRIGTQVWMAENLNTGMMVNSSGDEFPTQDNDIIEKLCYDNKLLNCDVYGGLYLWEEMMDYSTADAGGIRITQGICPEGWHVPTQQEWIILRDDLGEEDLAGGMLKDTSYLWRQKNLGASNETGFSALPAGKYGLYLGVETFQREAEKAYFWTTYFNASEQWKAYSLWHYDEKLTMIEGNHRLDYPNAMSVRCVQDP